MKASPRGVMLTIAFTLLAIGFILGVRTHGTQDYEQCGSVFAPGAVTCQSVSDAKPYTFGLLGLGALGILISFTASGEKTIHLN
jgi:hypothetical protein